MASADRALARELAELHRRLKGVERGRQIASSSVDVDGAPMKVTDGIAAGVHAEVKADALEQTTAALQVALAENDQAITQAQGELSNAKQRINDAFGEIDLKPDQAYVDAAKQQAIDAAAIDAQAKADQAEQDAKDQAAAWDTVTAQEAAADATAKAEAARVAAEQAAALDATAKAEAAEAAAAATAAADATTKANQAKADAEAAAALHAELVAGDAEQAAIDAAKLDAQSKADAAEQAAIDAAAADATAKAEAAESAAAATAAADATAKADAAQQAAIAAAAIDAQAKADAAEAAAIQAAAADATSKAAEAMSKATAALTAAEAAQATADNAIRTWYLPEPPWANNTSQPDDVLGDMWYDDDTGQAYRWNGTTWTVIVDQTIGQALSAAQDAQTTADGKITAYYQSSEPMSGDEGDLWFDTDDGNHAYRRTSSAWVSVADTRINAQANQLATLQSELTGLEGTVDGKSNVFVQSNQPTGLTAEDTGDIWINNGGSPRVTKIWTGTAWVEADSRTTQAVADIKKKITTYYTTGTTAPTGTFVDGDLWIDANGKIARRQGTSWVTVSDPKSLADAAQAAAISAAAADATAKAEAAEAAAVAAAAVDAQAKADAAEAAAEVAAQTYADTVASGASQSAIDAAAADAQQKADAAQAAAIAAAELDATAKAEAAEAAAAATAALDATAKADAAQAAAEEVAHLVENRALSRGTDLVTNGTGYLGNNYNFSRFTFDPSDAPNGAAGSFVTTTSSAFMDEVVPISPSKAYRYAFSVRETVPGAAGGLLSAIQPIDGAGLGIGPSHYMYEAGTTTTLAQALNPGDTEIHLTSGANWHGQAGKPGAGHQRRAIFWDYVDPFGKAWPIETYSRNETGADVWAETGIVGNVITLRAPYAGPAKPEGTPLSNGSGGSAFIYPTNVNPIGEEWTFYEDVIRGSMAQGAPNSGRSAANKNTGFPPGTAAAILGWLANRFDPTSVQAFAGVTFSDASAAQNTADQALSDAETKSEAAKQAAIAAAAADATAKAEAAEAAAAATAAADATAKANAAQTAAEQAAATYADTVASGASQSAIDAAAADATAKANAAKQAAIDAAAADATAKAEAAEAAAAATAAADATAKADAAEAAAIAAAAADATAKADAAREDAKAYALTTANGLAKTFWSTALPGTTKAPQNSTWYRHSGGKIISVFTQTAAGSQGSTWSARPITSEAIDNLDIGKLTAASGTINSLVVNEFAAKLANIIEANIGNLTVTGDTHLEALVAEQIAGDTASFMELTVDQILAGYLQAQWIITEEGSIIAGDPSGARVEVTSDGVRVYVVGPNGAPYEAVSMVNGEISFGVIGQDGTRLGGIASDGSVSGTSGSFAKDLRIKGAPLLGEVGGGNLPGWLDNLPRGVIEYNAQPKVVPQQPVDDEFRYLNITANLLPGRRYRIVAEVQAYTNSANGAIYLAILHAPGAVLPPESAPRLGPNALASDTGSYGHRVAPRAERFYTPLVEETRSFVSHVLGRSGAMPAVESGVIYVEDVGPVTPATGGDGTGIGSVVYQATWEASASRMYQKTPTLNSTTMPGRDGDIATWFWGAAEYDYQGAAWVFNNGATGSTHGVELGKTLPQALVGASIHKVEVYLRNKVWLSGDPLGSITINQLGATSLPTTKKIEGDVWVDDIAEGEGIWITLPVEKLSWFANGANRGLTIGDHDGSALNANLEPEVPTSGEFHGPGDTDPPLVRITYSR